MKHFLEKTAAGRGRVALEVNVRRAADRANRLEILVTGEGRIPRDLADREVAGRRGQQGLELGAIARVSLPDDRRRDDVRPHAAEEMGFHPIVFLLDTLYL